MRAELYGRVQSAHARAAFDLLEEKLREKGLEVRYTVGRSVRSVDFLSEGSHFFSFIPNRGDLLFYVRRPALNPKPHLHQLALRHHPGQVNTNRHGQPAENQRRETKVRIRNKAEAETLLSWLNPELPGLLR